MTAITVNYGLPTSTQYGPGQPVTTGIAGLWTDSVEFLKQWIGGSYVANAVQDHNHDGVNSAKIDTGVIPRNGSFEDALVGWTENVYSGGTIATTTARSLNGGTSLAITSSVLANGGGDVTCDEFIPVTGGEGVRVDWSRGASAANVSSELQIVWYDINQAQISVTSLLQESNTPTTDTAIARRVSAQATARFCKIKAIGGVPAVGTAVGTIYFDDIRVSFGVIEEPYVAGDYAVIYSEAGTAKFQWDGSSAIVLNGWSAPVNNAYANVLIAKIGRDGTVRVRWCVSNTQYNSYVYNGIRKNGAWVTSAYQDGVNAGPAQWCRTVDVAVNKGDTIELYAYATAGSAYGGFGARMAICVGNPLDQAAFNATLDKRLNNY